MNAVGLYFFSFLICGHLLKMGIKKALTCGNEEQSLSAQSLIGVFVLLMHRPGNGVTIVEEGFF